MLMQTLPHRGPIGEQELVRLQNEVLALGVVVEKSLVESVDLLKQRDLHHSHQQMPTLSQRRGQKRVYPCPLKAELTGYWSAEGAHNEYSRNI